MKWWLNLGPAVKKKAEVILDPEVEKAKAEEEDLVNPVDLGNIFGEFTAEQTTTLNLSLQCT